MRTTRHRRLVKALIYSLATASPCAAADSHVPADHSTIQAAVDAASDGDTIHIAPGIYVEQVAIRRKSLTLLGEPGTILRAFEDMGNLGFGFRNILLVHGPSEVTLRGITFQGDQLAEQQPTNDEGVGYDTRGVYIVDASGAVENCRFVGFRSAGAIAGPTRQSTALVVFNDLESAPVYDFRLAGSTFVDCFSGVLMRGAPNRSTLNVTVENNIIRGVGPTEAYSDNPHIGLEFVDGISGAVTGNSVSGFSYSGEGAMFPFAMGFFVRAGNFPDFVPVPGSWRIENNTFRDNDWHMTLIKLSGAEVLDNRFEGTGEADRRQGIHFSGDQGVVRGNEFRDMPVGVIALGGDPDFGDIVGVATDAVIADNRFCDVETPVVVQEAATATETGTLTCPFPVPALEIATAVEVSWPGFYEGWVLEGSTALEEWAPVELPVRSGGGRSSVTVPVDQSHLSFRLVEPASGE